MRGAQLWISPDPVPPFDSTMIYTEKRFEDWLAKNAANYRDKDPVTKEPMPRKFMKKGYLHFDNRIWLPDHIASFRKRLSDPERIAQTPFYPFVRWVMKTPRYKKNKDEKPNKRGVVKSRIMDLKKRPIAFAAHRDSLIYSFYAHGLTEEYERYISAEGFEACVLAYRSDLHLSNIDFAKEVFDEIGTRGPCTAIALDVTGFFDNLDHRVLKANWKRVIGVAELPKDQYKIFRSLTKYSYVNRGTVLRALKLELRGRKGSIDKPKRLCEDEKLQELRDQNIIVTNASVRDKNKDLPIGIPQGSPMSAILSNIYMIDYDQKMYELSKRRGFIYRRYCDDIMIVCNTEDAEELQKLAMEEIKALYLDINDTKADVVSFDPVFRKDGSVELRGFDTRMLAAGKEQYRNLQYLGFEFDGVRTYIRSASMARFYRRMMVRVGEVAKAAVGSNAKGKRPWTRKLYELYTVHGNRNFPAYAFNAAALEYLLAGKQRQGMDSPQIRKQMTKHVQHMQVALQEKLELRTKKRESREAAKARKADTKV
jgi:RNA-directed DNA polymerase